VKQYNQELCISFKKEFPNVNGFVTTYEKKEHQIKVRFVVVIIITELTLTCGYIFKLERFINTFVHELQKTKQIK